MKTILIILSALIALTGCTSQQKSMAWQDLPVYTDSDSGFLMDHSESGDLSQAYFTRERMINSSASLHIAVEYPDSMPQAMNRIAARFDGYINHGGTEMAVIRIPADKMELAMSAIGELGKVRSKSYFGEDVTVQYRDVEIRLENAMKARERYLELLARAENVEAAVMVERELERLNETIELMKGQMGQMEHLTRFATITVYISEHKKPGILGYVGIGLYHSVKWLFVRN